MRPRPSRGFDLAILGFHHVAISTPDLDRLVAFYRDVVGFEPVFEMAWEAGQPAIDHMMALEGVAARVVMLRTGDSFLEIFEFSQPEPRPQVGDRPVIDHGLTHICLAVDDAAAESARLEAAGLRLHTPVIDFGAMAGTYGRDPDGNVIEVLEVKDPSSPIAFANRRLASPRLAGPGRAVA